MRDALPEETPRAARVVADRGKANEWRVRITYAQGNTFDQYGRPGRLIDDIAVRLYRDDHRVVAFWHDGKFHGALLRIIGIPGQTLINAKELKALLGAS